MIHSNSQYVVPLTCNTYTNIRLLAFADKVPVFLTCRFYLHAPHATANWQSEIPERFCIAPRYMRAVRTAHSRFVLATCSIHVLSEIPQLCSTLHDMRETLFWSLSSV
jgi:hypothetical protein